MLITLYKCNIFTYTYYHLYSYHWNFTWTASFYQKKAYNSGYYKHTWFLIFIKGAPPLPPTGLKILTIIWMWTLHWYQQVFFAMFMFSFATFTFVANEQWRDPCPYNTFENIVTYIVTLRLPHHHSNFLICISRSFLKKKNTSWWVVFNVYIMIWCSEKWIWGFHDFLLFSMRLIANHPTLMNSPHGITTLMNTNWLSLLNWWSFYFSGE